MFNKAYCSLKRQVLTKHQYHSIRVRSQKNFRLNLNLAAEGNDTDTPQSVHTHMVPTTEVFKVLGTLWWQFTAHLPAACLLGQWSALLPTQDLESFLSCFPSEDFHSAGRYNWFLVFFLFSYPLLFHTKPTWASVLGGVRRTTSPTSKAHNEEFQCLQHCSW